MANTIFEQIGGTYTQIGDYMLPDLLPAEEEKEVNIGVWAMRHKRYLKQNHKVLYYIKLQVKLRKMGLQKVCHHSAECFASSC